MVNMWILFEFISQTYTHKCADIFNNPVYITFTDPSSRAGYDTRSIFKRSLTGLNSEFSLS